MAKYEIVKLARETYGTCATEQDYLFAEVIAAAERETCATLAEEFYLQEKSALAVAAAIRARKSK